MNNRIRPHAVQAIRLVEILDGNKTANRLYQQERDQEQENSRMVRHRPAFFIPAVCFSERWEGRCMGHGAVIVVSLFFSVTYFSDRATRLKNRNFVVPQERLLHTCTVIDQKTNRAIRIGQRPEPVIDP
jgi:hypothetical protein